MVNSAVHTAPVTWPTPTMKAYLRVAGYWICLSVLVCATDNRFRFSTWATLVFFLLASPAAILLLGTLSASLRRHVSSHTLLKSPQLEFSKAGVVTFRAIRMLLVLAEIGVALAMAKLIVVLLFQAT
jgi:hypothetical protein